MLYGTGIAPGTFGELMQGVLPPDDEPFLVTLPIQRFSRATFAVSASSFHLEVDPPTKQKSLEVAKRILALISKDMVGSLSLISDLPEGKGMASSSADLLATARAIQACFQQQTIPPQILANIFCDIDPTDAVMYETNVVFNHKSGKLFRQLPRIPPIVIIGIDEGGVVDSIEHGRRPQRYELANRKIYYSLLQKLVDAFERRDLEAIGRISTASAILNQDVLPKRHLNDLIGVGERHNALGVVAAHSGTVLGLMITREQWDKKKVADAIMEELCAQGLRPTVDHSVA